MTRVSAQGIASKHNVQYVACFGNSEKHQKNNDTEEISWVTPTPAVDAIYNSSCFACGKYLKGEYQVIGQLSNMHLGHCIQFCLVVLCFILVTFSDTTSKHKARKLIQHSQFSKHSSPAFKARVPISSIIKQWSNNEKTICLSLPIHQQSTIPQLCIILSISITHGQKHNSSHSSWCFIHTYTPRSFTGFGKIILLPQYLKSHPERYRFNQPVPKQNKL